MKGAILTFTLLVSLCSALLADTIPPLPLDQLKKIDLYYNDTLIKPFPFDTFKLAVYAGNVLGGNLKLSHLLTRNSLISFHADATKNFDYAKYLLWNGNISLGWLTKYFWHEFGLSHFHNKKESRYYDNIGLDYNPIWFIKDVTVRLNNRFRGARYMDTETNNFLTAHSNLSLCLPSVLGIIKPDAEILFQSNGKITSDNKLLMQAKFSDLVTFSGNFYVQPGVHYLIKENRLGVNINSGIMFSDIKTFLDLSYNSAQLFYFDTLYSNIFPYLVNDTLDYPINDLFITLSVLWKDISLKVNYEEYESYQSWKQKDTWIMPEIYNTPYREAGFCIRNKERFPYSSSISEIRNSLSLNYRLDRLNLIPDYIFIDSIQALIKKFDIAGVLCVTGVRRLDNQTLPRTFLLNGQIGYTWKLLRFFGSVENIFNNKYQIFPGKISLGRKYSAGLEIKK